MRRSLGLGLGGGALVALSLPPFGWWWLAWVGFGLFAVALRAEEWARRALIGLAFGLGQFGIGLFWMREFTLPGTFLAIVLEAGFAALAGVLTPRRLPYALPAALVLSEALRGEWPFGGLPLAGAALGQVAGPLGGAGRVGGGLLLVALASALGTVLLVLWPAVPRQAGQPAKERFGGLAVAGVAVVVALAGHGAPDGGTPTGFIDAVAVQGGGPRGLRAVDTDPRLTYERHLSATEAVEPGPDLLLWPEDVLDLPDLVERTPEGDVLSALADTLDVTFVAGVVEDLPSDTFANEAVAYDGDGDLVDRYEKNHRVPFGEYIPFRGLISRLADVSAVPRDARVGEGPGILRTPAGDLGVLISYEVFFADRGRAAVGAGAEVLLVPTNASSFTDSQVPTQQVAAARLRAIETGRDLLQAGPTGYSAFVDHRGTLVRRSVLEEEQVVPALLARRTGRTLYARFGDGWINVMAVLALAAAGLWTRREGQRATRAGRNTVIDR